MAETQRYTFDINPATKKLIKIRSAEMELTQGQYIDSLVLSDTQANSDYKGEIVQFPSLRSV